MEQGLTSEELIRDAEAHGYPPFSLRQLERWRGQDSCRRSLVLRFAEPMDSAFGFSLIVQVLRNIEIFNVPEKMARFEALIPIFQTQAAFNQ